MTHRPTPWTTKYKDRDRDELCVRDASGSIVADLRIHATVEEATLIAAAPTMLEALIRLKASGAFAGLPAGDFADAAIRQATGEGS